MMRKSIVALVAGTVVATSMVGATAPATAVTPVAVDSAVDGSSERAAPAEPIESVGPIATVPSGSGPEFPEGPLEVAVMPDGGVASGKSPFIAVPSLMATPSDVAVRVVDASLPGSEGGAVVWSGRLKDGWTQVTTALPPGGAYRVEISANSAKWEPAGWFVVRGAWSPGGNDVGQGGLSVSPISGGVSWGWASQALPGPIGSGVVSLGWNAAWRVPTSLRPALPRGVPAGWRLGVGSGSPWASLLVSTTDGIARVVGWDGSVLAFQRNGSDVWVQVTGGAPGFSNELSNVDAATWEFVSADGVITRFNGSAGVFRASKIYSSGKQISEVTWDAQQRISKVTNEVGRTATLTYADAPNACASQAWSGFGWATVPSGRLCQIDYPDGTYSSVGYVDGVAGVPQIGTLQDPGLVATTLGWDSSGRLVSERGVYANRVALTDPAAKDVLTRLTYDGSGRAVSMTFSSGLVQRLTFPSVTERVLKAWVVRADSAAKTSPVTTKLSAQATGFDMSQTSSVDPTSWMTIRAQDSAGGRLTMEVNEKGRVSRQVDSLGRVTTYEYNDLGMVIATTGPTRQGSAPQTGQDFDTRTERGKQVDLVGMRALVGVGAKRKPEFWAASPARGGVSYAWQGRPSGWVGQATAVWLPSKADEEAAEKAGGWRFRIDSSGATVSFRVGARACKVDQTGTCDMGMLPRGVKQVTVEIARGQDRGWFSVLAGAKDGSVKLIDATEITPGYGLQTESTSNDVFPGRTVDPKTVVEFANPALAQPSSVTSPGGLTSDYTYESAGWNRVLTVTTAGGAKQSTAYWPDNGTATVPSVCGGGQVQVSGQVKSITRQDGSVMTWWPDLSGRVVATQLAGRGGKTQTGCTSYFADGTVSTARAFDTEGQLVETTTNDPAVNGDYRVSRTTIIKGPGAKAGRLTQVWSQSRSNNLGQQVEQTGSSGVATASTYNSLGLPLTSTTTAPGGTTLTMAYTYRSRDAQVSALTVNGVKAADVAYDAFGRVDSVTYPGGVTQSYSYDAQGRPTLVSMRAGQATWSHAVTRTPYGRILGEKLTRGTNTEERAYTYDPGTGRLARAAITIDGKATTYDYSFGSQASTCPSSGSYVPGRDALRSGGSRNGTSYVTCHDSSGRVTSTTDPLVTGGSATSTISHDAFGRVTSITGAKPVSIDWTAQATIDRLVQGGDDSMIVDMESFGGIAVLRSVTTASGTETARFAGPFTLAVDDTGNSAGVIATQYAIPGSVQVTVQGGTATATLPDISGSAMATISFPALAGGSGAGDLVASDRFGPYGEPLSAPTWSSPVRDYTWRTGVGLETLPGSASVTIMGARAYHPGLGEFLTTDPLLDGGDSLYAYTSGDPINFRDSSGGSEEASWTTWLAAVGGGVLALVAVGAAWKAGSAATVAGAKAATWIAAVSGLAAAGAGSYVAIKASADSDAGLMAAGIAIAVVGGASAVAGIYRGVRNVNALRAPESTALVLHPQQAPPNLDNEFVQMFANVDDVALAGQIHRKQGLQLHPDKGGDGLRWTQFNEAYKNRLNLLKGDTGKMYGGAFLNEDYFTGPSRASSAVPQVAPPSNANRYSNGSHLSFESGDGVFDIDAFRRNGGGF